MLHKGGLLQWWKSWTTWIRMSEPWRDGVKLLGFGSSLMIRLGRKLQVHENMEENLLVQFPSRPGNKTELWPPNSELSHLWLSLLQPRGANVPEPRARTDLNKSSIFFHKQETCKSYLSVFCHLPAKYSVWNKADLLFCGFSVHFNFCSESEVRAGK